MSLYHRKPSIIPKEEDKLTFADALKAFYTPGIPQFAPKVRLTKSRARMLMMMVREFAELTSYYEDKYGKEYADEMCATIQWITNQVSKRWSGAELAQD